MIDNNKKKHLEDYVRNLCNDKQLSFQEKLDTLDKLDIPEGISVEVNNFIAQELQNYLIRDLIEFIRPIANQSNLSIEEAITHRLLECKDTIKDLKRSIKCQYLIVFFIALKVLFFGFSSNGIKIIYIAILILTGAIHYRYQKHLKAEHIKIIALEHVLIKIPELLQEIKY